MEILIEAAPAAVTIGIVLAAFYFLLRSDCAEEEIEDFFDSIKDDCDEDRNKE